jgi:hypothetical protein
MTIAGGARLEDGGSALEAYATDLPLSKVPNDATSLWIFAASLLRQAGVSATSGRQQKTLIAAAVARARVVIDAGMLARGCQYDQWPARNNIDVLRLLAEHCENSGALTLSAHLLESLSACVGDETQRGRVLADRARVSRKRGLVDLAKAQAEEVKRRGTALKSPDLVARAWVTLGAVAQVSGNYVEMRRCAKAAVRIAERAGLDRLASAAHGGLGVQAAVRQAFSEAVTHFWSAFVLAKDDRRFGHNQLSNLAHVLYASGHADEARSVASLVLSEAPIPSTRLGALGTYALSSARLRILEDVQWACGEVSALATSSAYPREVAVALTDCGCALEILGAAEAGRALRARAEVIAGEHGFNDLVFAEGVTAMNGSTAAPQPLDRTAARAATAAVQASSERQHHVREAVYV